MMHSDMIKRKQEKINLIRMNEIIKEGTSRNNVKKDSCKNRWKAPVFPPVLTPDSSLLQH